MKISISFVMATMMALFPAVCSGVAVTITFNQNKVDPTKSCTTAEWATVTESLQALATTRLRSLRGQEERELSSCGKYCVYIGPGKSGRRDEEAGEEASGEDGGSHVRQLNWISNSCVDSKNLVINQLNNELVPKLSSLSPHLCRNLIQSQHTLACV